MFGLVALSGCTKKETEIIQPASAGGAPKDEAEGFEVASAVSPSNTEVIVTFTSPAGTGAGKPTNYTISEADGGVAYVTVQAALVLDGGTRVALTTLAQSDLRYRLTVANVQGPSGWLIDAAGATADLFGTAPGGTSPDTDGDGLPDANEQRGWAITVFEANGQVLTRQVTSRPDLADTDGDGMSDEEERRRGTDPREEDTDRDGLTDASETRIHFSIPYRQDTDSDGIADGDEVNRNHTSPLLSDTDGDTISDFTEIFERVSHPLIADVPEAQIAFAGDLDLRLNIEYTDGTTITTQDGTKLSRAETTGTSFTDSLAPSGGGW